MDLQTKHLMQLRKTIVISKLIPYLEAAFTRGDLRQKAISQGYTPPSDRTLRRWITEMEKNGIIKSTGLDKRYRFCERKEHNPPSPKSFFELHPFDAIAHIQKPREGRSLCSYESSFLEAYIPNSTFYISLKERESLEEAGRRLPNPAPCGTLAKKIYQRLTLELTYNSSRLEGNTYSLLETERLFFQQKEPSGKTPVETMMIVNHKDAIRYLVDRAVFEPMDFATLKTMHYLLSEGLLESKDCGRVREEGVLIGGSTYIPVENAEELKQHVMEVLRKGALIENAFEQSFFLLIHLSYLQIFLDVNNRTARLMSNIPLIQQNFIPVSFQSIEKSDYGLGMIAFYETLDWRPFLALWIQSYHSTCASFDMNVQAQSLDWIFAQYRKEHRAALTHIIRESLSQRQWREWIKTFGSDGVAKEHVEDFGQGIEKALGMMEEARIFGLGITKSELWEWLATKPFSQS